MTLRSPIVIRKLFDATAGKVSTLSSDSGKETALASKPSLTGGLRKAWRCILGGLPNSTDMGRSTGSLLNCRSVTAR